MIATNHGSLLSLSSLSTSAGLLTDAKTGHDTHTSKKKVKHEIGKAKRIGANRQMETCRGTWALVKEIRGKKTSNTYNVSNPEETEKILVCYRPFQEQFQPST